MLQLLGQMPFTGDQSLLQAYVKRVSQSSARGCGFSHATLVNAYTKLIGQVKINIVRKV